MTTTKLPTPLDFAPKGSKPVWPEDRVWLDSYDRCHRRYSDALMCSKSPEHVRRAKVERIEWYNGKYEHEDGKRAQWDIDWTDFVDVEDEAIEAMRIFLKSPWSVDDHFRWSRLTGMDNCDNVGHAMDQYLRDVQDYRRNRPKGD